MGPVTGHLSEPNTGAPDATWMGPATDRARFSAPAAASLVPLRMECLARNAGTRRSATAMVGRDQQGTQLARSHPRRFLRLHWPRRHSDVSTRCPRSWWTALVWICD